jgi:hypothetical protein
MRPAFREPWMELKNIVQLNSNQGITGKNMKHRVENPYVIENGEDKRSKHNFYRLQVRCTSKRNTACLHYIQCQ